MHDFTNTNADFPETRMGPGGSVGAGMDRLYWSAVYAFLRRKRFDRDTARDMTSDFFADKVYGKEFFAKADPTRGPLRVFIMSAVENYAVSWRRRPRNQAGGTNLSVQTDELERFDHDQETARSPEEAFEAALDREIVNEALARCERCFEGRGKTAHWKVFEARVVRPSVAQMQPASREDVARDVGFENEAAASAAQQVVVKRFGLILEEVRAEIRAD